MNEDTLKLIANNQALFDAVLSKVLSKFDDMKLDESMDDETIGQITRARLTGRKKVEEAFTDIIRLKTHATPDQKPNPAR